MCHAHLTSPRSVKIVLLSHTPKRALAKVSLTQQICVSTSPHFFCDRHRYENTCAYAPLRILSYVPRRLSPARACCPIAVVGDSLWDERGTSTDSIRIPDEYNWVSNALGPLVQYYWRKCEEPDYRASGWARSREYTHIPVVLYTILERHLDLVHRNEEPRWRNSHVGWVPRQYLPIPNTPTATTSWVWTDLPDL